VLKAEKKDIKEPPPLLFCLSDLQREANKFYGMSAKETLDAAQSLYETHKMLSYPRTSCCHLATSTIGLAESSMRALGHSIDVKKAGRHVFNDKKVGEAGHHALMPLRTKSVAGKPLSAKEQKVFDLVAGRFVAAFHGPHVYAKTEAWLRAAEYDLYASARQTVTPGWHAYYPPGWKPLAETSPAVMTAKKGDVLPLDRADLNEGKTSPPPRFTEASLLSMMKNAWRYAEAPDIREALKDAQGIGTEATRAAVIEVLKNRKYVETKGKSFGVTGLGMAIANAAKKMDLVASDIGFTGIWENKLSGISKGVSSYESFVAEVKALVAKEIDKIRAGASSLSTAVGGAERHARQPRRGVLLRREGMRGENLAQALQQGADRFPAQADRPERQGFRQRLYEQGGQEFRRLARVRQQVWRPAGFFPAAAEKRNEEKSRRGPGGSGQQGLCDAGRAVSKLKFDTERPL